MEFSGGLLLKVSAFMRMKFRVVGCERKSFLISHIALLCRSVLMACNDVGCNLVVHESMYQWIVLGIVYSMGLESSWARIDVF